jgi:hypothetical protein
MFPTNIEISVGVSNRPVSILLADDIIAENDEIVLVIMTPVNPLDVINQNTTLLFIDTDGLHDRNES